MALYIKTNKKVAEYLKVDKDRNKLSDGNFLLWQADMQAFGKLTELPAILEQIGGIALRPHEARQEQDGAVLRPLPEPEDERFKSTVEVVAEESETNEEKEVEDE